MPLKFHNNPPNKRNKPANEGIVLIPDCREIKNKIDRDYIPRKLQEEGMQVGIRSLQSGDIVLIFRDSDGHERVVDYIVKRKTLKQRGGI